MSIELSHQGFDRPTYRSYIHKRLGSIGIATDALDRKIRSFRNSPRLPEMDYDDVREEMQPYVDDSLAILSAFHPSKGSVSANAWFRLKGRTNFATELVMAPHVFAGNDMDKRAELANGTAGLAVDIVSEVLPLYDDKTHDAKQLGRLRGVAEEYTLIAVGNYLQDGNRIVLPGSQQSDYVRYIDSIMYGTDDDGRNYRSFIQVKSDSIGRRNAAFELPRSDVINITSDVYGNELNSLRMSRLLDKEHRGKKMKRAERREVLLAGKAIVDTVIANRNQFNTQFAR